MAEYVWKDRKRTFLGLPWSFTRYALTEDRLIIDVGFFSRKEEEIRLYRITDISLKRTFGQRILGIGTIHCCSGDKSTPEFDIKNIKHPKAVKNTLSDMVEEQRDLKRIAGREYLDADGDGHPDHFDERLW